MAEAMECRREIIVEKSADEAWEWLSNLRNVMTTNQFHLSIDLDDAVARKPAARMDVPILHEIMERRFYRIARITRCEDYEIAWGERIPDDAGYEDNFPHSEGWKVEALERNVCRITNHLRGRFRLPLGQMIGQYAWDAAMPVILDNDLQDAAFAMGAIKEKREIPMPASAAVLLRLVHARQIDGVPINEYVDTAAKFLKDPG